MSRTGRVSRGSTGTYNGANLVSYANLHHIFIVFAFNSSKLEAEAWKELSDSYEAHRKSVQAEMEKRKRALAAAKSKGKERATESDLDDWDVERRDLPERFLTSGSVDRARGIVLGGSSKASSRPDQLKGLEYTVRPPIPTLRVSGVWT